MIPMSNKYFIILELEFLSVDKYFHIIYKT